MTQPFPGGLTAPLDWIDGILPLIPGAHVDWIKHTILRKTRDFFKRSNAWRDWIGPITMDETTPFYSAELSDYKATLCSVLAGYRHSDGFPLGLVQDADTAVQQDALYSVGLPQYTYRTVENLIAIFPMVGQGVYEQVSLYVSMQPIDLCMPDWIKDRYYDAILSGVLGAAYLTPGLNYKPDLGARYERRFLQWCSRAAQEAQASGTGMPQKVPVPRQVLGSQRRRMSSVAVSGLHW